METIYKRTSAVRFCAAMRENTRPEYRPFLTWYTARDYAKMGARCYIGVGDGSSGYALVGKELISVFAQKGSKQGGWAVKDAIENGARKLFCFDGFLKGYYQIFGFQVTETAQFNRDYAPDNWDYERFGTPEVVWMELID